MAEKIGNTAVPHGDHDRVAMLSLRADGTPDQHDPEIIGDKEFALEATRRQFAEQAVSAVDQRERGVVTGPGAAAEHLGQDPTIEHLQTAHDAAADAAQHAADATVRALFTDDTAQATGPADEAPASKPATPKTASSK